jgi:cytochrome P450
MIGVLIVFTLVFLVALWYRERRAKFLKREQIGLSGPDYSFWIGNLKMWAVPGDAGRQLYRDQYNKYGDTWGFFIGPKLQIHTIDVDIIKEVLIKQFNSFTDRMKFSLTNTEGVSGNGIVTLTGDHWKDVRNGVTPVFSSGKIKQISEIVKEKNDIFLNNMSTEATRGQVFDIYNYVQKLTLEVIGKAAFAIDCECQTNADDPFYRKCNEFFSNVDPSKSRLIIASVMFPELQFLWKRSRFLAPFGAAEDWLINGLIRVFEQRKNNLETFKGIDVLQIMLQSRLDSKQQPANGHSVGSDPGVINRKTQYQMTDIEILGNSFVFLLAGYETTSTALAYSCWLLAKHPEVQRKLQDEVRNYLAAKAQKVVGFDAVRDLHYLDAVFHECLRMYPPVPGFVARSATDDVTVKGIPLSKDMEIVVGVEALHYDSRYWESPELFRPERFLTDGRFDPSTFNPMTWLPFGSGPRNCVGLRFAEMEYKLSLASLMSRFTLQLPEGEKGKLVANSQGVLLRPAEGVHVKILEE